MAAFETRGGNIEIAAVGARELGEIAQRFDLLIVYAVLFMVFLYGPMLLMPLFSFNEGTFATFPLKGFTTVHYAEMAANTSMMVCVSGCKSERLVLDL